MVARDVSVKQLSKGDIMVVETPVCVMFRRSVPLASGVKYQTCKRICLEIS
jgi:hypothetical protein